MTTPEIDQDIEELRQALREFDENLDDPTLLIRAAWALAAPCMLITVKSKAKDQPSGNLSWARVSDEWVAKVPADSINGLVLG